MYNRQLCPGFQLWMPTRVLLTDGKISKRAYKLLLHPQKRIHEEAKQASAGDYYARQIGQSTQIDDEIQTQMKGAPGMDSTLCVVGIVTYSD